MQQKELSVIIPVYNAEKYIGRCLQSILKCPESKIEVVVVDDGSKDASLLVCKEMAAKDARLNVFSKKMEAFLRQETLDWIMHMVDT